MTQAYPLKWPGRVAQGWRLGAASGPSSARASASIPPLRRLVDQQERPHRLDATQRLTGELKTMGVRDGQWVISSNVELRNDGLPRPGQRPLKTPALPSIGPARVTSR
jgi:hypothetical protein